MANRYTFQEVMKLAETEPDTKIWCISMDGRIDCLTTAGEIKMTIGNFNWDGVEFMKVESSNDNKEKQDKEQIEEQESNNEGFTISGKPIKHKVQLFKANNISDLNVMVNQFIENLNNIVKIDYQIGQSNTIGLLSLEYSVMVHYIED